MLYVSTRNNIDSFTAYRALHENRTPDGGYYVPNRLPVLTPDEISEFSQMTFGERMARVLNIFFPVGLSGWDVDFAIGRNPYKLVRLSSRLYIAELWHNLQANFAFTERALYTKLCENNPSVQDPTNWAKIAIRIATFFGICGELFKAEINIADFAGITSDYGFITAAFYAQKMGLPIGNIICSSDENGGAWDLFRRGELSLSGKDLKEEPRYFEFLVYEILGTDAVTEYLHAHETQSVFKLNEGQLMRFSKAMDGTVISGSRCSGLIKSIYRTHNYVSEPNLAITYGGLQDYRSRKGENRVTLLISDISPRSFERLISETTGLSPAEMRKIISNS